MVQLCRIVGSATAPPADNSAAPWLKTLAVMFLACVLGACGGGGEAAPPATSAIVGVAGGTVLGPGGAMVVVPAGGLSAERRSRYRSLQSAHPRCPAVRQRPGRSLHDGYGIVRLVEQLTRNAGGALHWGQSNGMLRFIDLESTYGDPTIDKWKAAQRMLGGDTFTNLFMQRCGLT